MPKWTQPHCSLIGNIIRFYKPEVVKICTVSAMSFSISGRILSLYFDKSALFKHDSILGIYCGFAKPTCARAFTHCLAVIGFSSVICVRNSDILSENRCHTPYFVSDRFKGKHQWTACKKTPEGIKLFGRQDDLLSLLCHR